MDIQIGRLYASSPAVASNCRDSPVKDATGARSPDSSLPARRVSVATERTSDSPSSPSRVWAVEMPRKARPSTGYEHLPPPPKLPVSAETLSQLPLPNYVTQCLNVAKFELSQAAGIFNAAVTEIESDQLCALGAGGSLRPGALEATRIYWREKQLMLERAGAKGVVVSTTSLAVEAPLGLPVAFVGARSPPYRGEMPGTTAIETKLAPRVVPEKSSTGCEWQSTTHGGVRTLDPRVPAMMLARVAA